MIRIAGLGLAALLLAACSGNSETAGTAQAVGAIGAAGTPTASGMPAATVAFLPAGEEQLSPKDPIVVKASGGTLQAVAVTNPQTGNAVQGELSPDKTTWTSKDRLRYASTYQVVATAVNQEGAPTEQRGEVHTVKPAGVASPALFQSASGDFGVGLIIGLKFDRDIADKATVEKSLKVTSSPSQDGGWYWVNKRELHYRPKDYWKPGSTVKLETANFGTPIGGGLYGGQDVSATYKVHDSWVAKADGKTHQIKAFHNGQLVKTAPISMGKTADTPPRGPTPTFNGTHTVLGKEDHKIMDSCSYGVCEGDPGYYKAPENWNVRISNDGEYLHENLKTVGVQGSDNVSNGCLNMNTENAKWFFDTFNVGDVVEVTNSGGPQLSINNGHGDWAISWSAWQAGSALHG
ncbi:Ig-like domain-containing protein [Amycolatopsis sp. Hca4]|uniref:L,D-transpeptidase n=1 Tax=Amycolatopsis sp. Hca4 TaxID=2742131 RepID=UPI00158FD3F1|nr:Ig-like domain-containing protein [Amycolatopsis sp. Hca4]QKV79728.1 L,D-transpeptidase family protein [Amycolatopsis sp. Hca4]